MADSLYAWSDGTKILQINPELNCFSPLCTCVAISGLDKVTDRGLVDGVRGVLAALGLFIMQVHA